MATVPIPVPFIIHLDASKIIAMVNLDNPEICPVWQAWILITWIYSVAKQNEGLAKIQQVVLIDINHNVAKKFIVENQNNTLVHPL